MNQIRHFLCLQHHLSDATGLLFSEDVGLKMVMTARNIVYEVHPSSVFMICADFRRMYSTTVHGSNGLLKLFSNE
jgi:hypothetical protein